MDAPARDSLACDLMEPVRPEIDAWLLDWITREPLKREWFFEQRDGNCRLMGSFAARLSQTAPMWARAVAPLTEWVAPTNFFPQCDLLDRWATETTQALKLRQIRRDEDRNIHPPIKLPSRYMLSVRLTIVR